MNVVRLGRSIVYFMIDNILDNSRIDTSLNEYSPVVNDCRLGRSID